MKEPPIIFGAESIKSIISGRKTQTRRVIKLPSWSTGLWEDVDIDACEVKDPFHDLPSAIATISGCFSDIQCPYGLAGDRLWVREAFRPKTWSDGGHYGEIEYRADGAVRTVEGPWEFLDAFPYHIKPDAWRSPIHLPRFAARLFLEVVSVRVERLQAIPFYDIRAEGISCPEHDFPGRHFCASECPDLRKAFAKAWDAINGKRAPWSSDPWVWGVGFRRVAP